MSMDLEITESERGDVLVLTLAGRLDTRGAPGFEQKVIGLVSGGRHLLAIDARRLEFICSGGIRVLVMAAKRLAGEGKGLALCALSESVRTVLDVSGLTGVFETRPSVDEAVEWLVANRRRSSQADLAGKLIADHHALPGPAAKRGGASASAAPTPSRQQQIAEIAGTLLAKKDRPRKKP